MNTKYRKVIQALKRNAKPVDDEAFPLYKDEIVAGVVRAATGVSDLEIAANRFGKIVGVKPATLLSDMKKSHKVWHKRRAGSKVPSDYSVDNGCLTHSTTEGPKRIADCDARITANLKNEDSSGSYKIEGITIHGSSFTIDIPADDFADQAKLKARFEVAMGHNCAVAANMSAHLGPAIKRLSNSDIPTVLAFSTTGWREIFGIKRFLMPGVKIDGVEVSLPNPKHCYHLSETADLEKALEALDHLLRAHPPEMTSVAFAFIMQPPLAELVGWQEERYALFIQGLTGSLKTAFAQILMCIWGEKFNLDSSLIKWGEGATNNAIMALASAARAMPFLLDNYKPNTGGGARAFINLTQNILEGGEKERLQKNSELRTARSVSAWPLCTGEDIPDSDAATLARLLTVHVPARQGFNEELKIAQDLSAHLNAIGTLWLRVLTEWIKQGSALKSMSALSADFIRKWSDKLHRDFPRLINKMRVATNLATNELTWHLLLRIPALRPILQKYSDAHAKGLIDIAQNLENSTRDATEAEKFLEALREALQTGALRINKERGLMKCGDSTTSYHGWWEGNDLCISPDVTLTILKKITSLSSNGLSKTTLYRQLKGMGAIAGHGENTTTMTFSVRNKTERVLYLNGSFVRYQMPIPEVDDFDIDV